MGVIERITEDGCKIDDWNSIIQDRPLIVSVSGGKDSTAVILWVTENGLLDRCEFVFADTGWEHPELYEYLESTVIPLCGGRFHRVSSAKYPGGMPDIVIAKGMFPKRHRRYCTEELKTKPIKTFVAERRAQGLNPIVLVGVRAAESVARSKLETWDRGGPMGKDVDIWRPLITWTVADVVNIHNRHNVSPCSLYLKKVNASKRVGCWPCINSRKSEIRAVADTTPERIDQIRDLEARATVIRNAKIIERGDIPGSSSENFFMPKIADGKNWGIDRVVEWSRTSRGGKQFEMFTTDTPGCQMWGLCDMGDD